MAISTSTQNFLQTVVSQQVRYDQIYALYNISTEFDFSEDDLRIFLGNNNSGSLVRLIIVDINNFMFFNNFSNGKLAIELDENDDFSVSAINASLSAYLGKSIDSFSDPLIEYKNKIKADFNKKTSVNTLAEMRADFYNQYMTKNTASLRRYGLFAAVRLKIWYDYYKSNGNIDVQKIVEKEIIAVSENDQEIVDELVINNNGQENLLKIYHKAYGQLKYYQYNNSIPIYNDAFGKDRYPTVEQKDSFFRVFQNVSPATINTTEMGGLSAGNTASLIQKMEEIGLLRLASYANEISAYGKKRAASLTSIQKSAADYIDPNSDTPWLLLLNEVLINLKKDPVTFASLNYYFPSLLTFLLDAVALVGDYSNNGRGGDPNDVVNDPSALLDSLEKAFGIDENGKAVFTLAFRSVQTAKRIEEVLKKSPFRPNIAPANPDIFHLRLGAANFYIPPVSIEVNSNFKAGSLMASALRQKNSPKFNSGYKETAIRMRLFFPNYEEIWGISIDDASTLNLNEEFRLDFKQNGDSEEKIDKFLSSLRGLVAAFKYSPFVPVKNHYLNSVHGITAVGFVNMTISTIPNFPFALAVDLELVNFNHKPFLPMIPDFNQAIHWGKYRQYMGKAAGQLNRYVNEQFLLKSTDVKELDTTGSKVMSRGVDDGLGPQTVPVPYIDPVYQVPSVVDSTKPDVVNTYDYDVLKTNILEQWTDGNHITFYAPAEAQTKIFLPSAASFRSDQEKTLTDLGGSFWDRLLNSIGIDLNQSSGYGITLTQAVDISKSDTYSKSTKNIILDALDLIVAGVNSKSAEDKAYDYLITSFIKQNNNNLNDDQKTWLKNKDRLDTTKYPEQATYNFQGKFIDSTSLNSVKRGFIDISNNPQEYLNYIIDKKYNDTYTRTGRYPDKDTITEEVNKAFSVALYERFFKAGPIQSLMEAARARSGNFLFNEWEVPMLRVDLDPNSVIINGVTVSLSNNLVKLQVQMQDEPTYQHIGGKDSAISISMTVIGEKELIKLKSMFDHVSGLARLEHATGVIGFLGIKNIITSLAGIKYVMPLTYNVSTKPNFPHVYDVQLTLLDFDIFQQKRENLSSKQQVELVEEFGTKKNPFLRIKQLWGAFNAYPDLPLAINNSTGETVGCLDPDFYFRSFEMFDNDVINHIDVQMPMAESSIFDEPKFGSADTSERWAQTQAVIKNKILEFIRIYNLDSADVITRKAKANLLSDMAEYIQVNNIAKNDFYKIFYDIIYMNDSGFTKDSAAELLTKYISFDSGSSENNPYNMLEAQPAAYQVGNLSPNDMTMLADLEGALAGKYNLVTDFNQDTKSPTVEDEVSFDPDEVMFHKQIFMLPAKDVTSKDDNRIPAFMNTVLGVHFGYIDKSNGRFYLVVGNENVKIDADTKKSLLASNFIEDTETPDRGTSKSMTGVAGTTPLSGYQNPYSNNVARHWETMLVDTKYRDISGRMIRAFPTYMLWLIDEGGYFAGVKMFDNFYGLQSIIDFSVVSSEDLLGDTLIFRVSNLYSKLTRKESSAIFSLDSDFNDGELTLSEGLAGIVDRALNISRNVLSGLRNDYIVDIANIRLKPGVRVHLRGGYGSNPNSLQTLFNGVITNVEQGEIVTVTAQSDAIELGAIVNSTDQKGHSGKIDGGVDTGMYLSEPRDLMVRLLSMGTSRVREAFAHATKGTVFSENRFGIRHFGTILYEPMNPFDAEKENSIRDKVAATFAHIGGGKATGGFSFGLRGDLIPLMGQMWANFSVQPDLEIFKRNIYAGNGLGIAQFLGGDLEDGWSTAASIVPDESYNDRTEGYLGRLTDLTYNRLLENYQKKDDSAKETLDNLTASSKLAGNQGVSAGLVKGAFGIATTGLATILGGPIAGGIVGIPSLLGVLSNRGGTNIFRTMGLISANDDDDLPGYDEVSFRAQTFMRTVWDLFQTCARLLPNYIVAVRPFEDRSTVFYGKPHWLYTSGVMPITTGYPGAKEAAEKGVSSGPDTLQPNQFLNKIMDTINKDTNPLADYAKFFQAYEPNETFRTVAEAISSSTGIYSPTSYFAGKLLNFYSNSANTFYDMQAQTGSNGIAAKLPVSKGFVDIGPHLPIIPKEMKDKVISKTETLFSETANRHKQISNLPPRYGFPYFSVNEQYNLENSSTVRLNSSTNIILGKGDKIEYNNLDKIIRMELDLFHETKFSLMPSLGSDTTSGTVNLDTPLDFSIFYDQISGSFNINPVKIIMPLPQVNLAIVDDRASGNIESSQVTGDYSFEYKTNAYGKLTYKEWGAPETAEDEQFYIAMRWPYNPEGIQDNAQLQSLFKSTYFAEGQQLYGTVEDYKKRKILVYNPANGRAVVCKPAYFMWGKENLSASVIDMEGKDVAALVSPDASYFLGIITFTSEEETISSQSGAGSGRGGGVNADKLYLEAGAGYRTAPVPQECFFAFVPDDVPVGVLSTSIGAVNKFKLENEYQTTDQDGNVQEIENYIVGFGNFAVGEGEELMAKELTNASDGGINVIGDLGRLNDSLGWYTFSNADYKKVTDILSFGGNAFNIKDNKSYFQLAIDKDYAALSSDELNKKLELESNERATVFAPVYDASDMISIQARSYYDEKFDTNVSVIAGNGRELYQAAQIWDLFRAQYHTFDSVKKIFFDLYSLDPDSEEEFPEQFRSLLSGDDFKDVFSTFGSSGGSAVDEFAILFGSDYGGSVPKGKSDNSTYSDVIEFMRKNYIDATLDDGGLLAYFNNIISKKLRNIYTSFFQGENVLNVLQFSIDAKDENGEKVSSDIAKVLKENINTPKQLFLLMVGIFRQRMWEDPYARAWLVLKPDKKPGWVSSNGWSFKPVDKVFRAFIDPASDYAKPSKKAKFLQLLVNTRGEGNESSTYFSEAVDDIGEFASRTIGPIITAVSDALSGLISMFKTSMQQLGYALSEVSNFKKQANVLNKVLNDSIYYSLGRPGTILRAVDNPFTREYGEPVIEIREPFQRIHYISSFSHILSNQIQENINNVATTITAVSDGKYPVTVSLDKAAPAERQVEKTVETGIYYDNAIGSGITGILHPFMHPLETVRAVAKNTMGVPDELSARRIALAHLKESIKDIYGGELIIIGNGDVRPHDLVYLSDVYERMYGIFEVEQVVHHFTPELGFITSITPNALVTVNDPARWFMTSWVHSWMNVQVIRNDTRVYLDNIRNAESGLSIGGNISVDRLGEALNAQIVGGFQFTHGSSALVKDIMANQTAIRAPGVNQSLLNQSAQSNGGAPSFSSMVTGILAGGLLWKGWKWVRDNVLDQHGCYVQYLNKNGQPMDAGLSFNQGMVVGSHHSKALLPGLLGTRVKARTPEGNAYIRTDDLLKNLGWNEVEINDLRRQVSYEAALVHAQVLKLSGLGPDKAAFEWQFKVICRLDSVIDGDTIDVIDVISGNKFRVRFDGVNTAETNTIEGKVEYPDTRPTTVPENNLLDTSNVFNLSFLDISSPAGKAKIFVKEALSNKIFVLRINQTRYQSSYLGGKAVTEADFEPGSSLNNIQNYQLDIFGSGERQSSNSVNDSRVLATIFYKNSDQILLEARSYISNIFRSNLLNVTNIKNIVKNEIHNKSAFYIKFDNIFSSIESLIGNEYFNITNITDSLFNQSDEVKKLYSRLVYFKIIEKLYDKASEWPRVSWDEYYSDGSPITLNWELIVNNLAQVFVKDLQKESQSVVTADETLPMPTSVFN